MRVAVYRDYTLLDRSVRGFHALAHAGKRGDVNPDTFDLCPSTNIRARAPSEGQARTTRWRSGSDWFATSLRHGGFKLQSCQRVVQLSTGRVAVELVLLLLLRDRFEAVFLLAERANESLAQLLLAGALAE